MAFITTGCRRDADPWSIYVPDNIPREGLVYEYSIPEGSFTRQFWYYQRAGQEGDSAWLLEGQQFDERFRLNQYVLERIGPRQAQFIEYKLFQYDSSGNMFAIPLHISRNTSFVYDQKAPPFSFELSWKDAMDTTTSFVFRKQRQFEKDTILKIGASSLPCRKYVLREFVENIQVGSLEKEYNSDEYYATGKGLVSYKRGIGGAQQLNYVLTGVYTLPDFEKKYQVDLVRLKAKDSAHD